MIISFNINIIILKYKFYILNKLHLYLCVLYFYVGIQKVILTGEPIPNIS